MPPRPTIPADDLYARLEVPPDASFEAIEIAWRALLKRHHPDVAGHETLELAKRINVAHDWLSSPMLRERYDRERRGATVARARWSARQPVPAAPFRPTAGGPVVRRAPADPGAALRRFVDRVGRLSRDELDRLSVAETTSIAFVASIHRFLSPSQIAAIEAVEREVRSRLPPPAWANAPTRDAVLAAAHELVLATFLDEHLSEPFRGRARDRLMRGWEAAVDQRRYGPNTRGVAAFVARAGDLRPTELRTLVEAGGRGRLGDDPWPAGLDPHEDEGLRVSTVLAARDAATAARETLARLEPSARARAERLLARTAHGLVLRHAFTAAEFDRLVGPWRAATGDPGTGRAGREGDAGRAGTAGGDDDEPRTDTRPEPRVRRR